MWKSVLIKSKLNGKWQLRTDANWFEELVGGVEPGSPARRNARRCQGRQRRREYKRRQTQRKTAKSVTRQNHSQVLCSLIWRHRSVRSASRASIRNDVFQPSEIRSPNRTALPLHTARRLTQIKLYPATLLQHCQPNKAHKGRPHLAATDFLQGEVRSNWKIINFGQNYRIWVFCRILFLWTLENLHLLYEC